MAAARWMPAPVFAAKPDSTRAAQRHPAMFWEPSAGAARCLTCPNECERNEGETTLCRTRINIGGKLYTMTYGLPCVLLADPLEKNPLFHVAPGSQALGVGTAGCNLRCLYCQNWEFSQSGPDQTRNMELDPAGVVQRARDRGLKWITFSYTEPVAYLEYALDTAALAHEVGLKVAVATGGFIHPKPLDALIRACDAFSVTCKGYSEEFYRKYVGCPLANVWTTIKALVAARRWVEVVTLVIPTLNDDPNGLRTIARGLAQLNRDIPLHFLRFAPAWKLANLPTTPPETLERAREGAVAEGLRFAYISNLPGHRYANTACPKCGRMLIERAAFNVLKNDLHHGACPGCGTKIPGVDL